MKHPSQTILIDKLLLDQSTEAALASPRRRKNHNFHTSEAEGANRLLNAVEPGSYIQPHRHLDSTKDETFVVVRGRFGLVLFDEAGDVGQTAILAAGTDSVGANIPHGTYHTLVSLQPGSIFFEAKAGPYVPISDAERSPWAPREGEPQATDYLRKLEQLFR
jgi:cupin fold WbuC family metalloprotein